MDANRSTLEFEVTLLEVHPPVWRRIEVPASYTFWDLHVAIQDAMGWLDYHLHTFRVRDDVIGATAEIGIPDGDAWPGAPECLPDWEVPVTGYLQAPGARATYEYDFGDGWVHEINLVAIGRRQSGTKYPRCLDGRRACPPEDCGGPPGYAQLLETIADSTDDEYASMMEWLGGSFDPEAFSPEQVRFDNPRKRWRIAFEGDD